MTKEKMLSIWSRDLAEVVSLAHRGELTLAQLGEVDLRDLTGWWRLDLHLTREEALRFERVSEEVSDLLDAIEERHAQADGTTSDLAW